ncbi:unnamed protein product [Cyprideis torosa]|uniref:Uncharacterized protein n=1 Tax=Cyprideis torosa TaxID=163714 RepID=A0A7R8W6P0_9CRUS|nr:unnamed protein product [Cyprideis torosa]CAG0885436.1 unnamed protein product [Cyprideis torosa]
MGVTVYCVQEGSQSNLLASKSRLCPLKPRTLTVPRAELTALLLGMRLIDRISTEMKPPTEIRLFTESELCLKWINSPPPRSETFLFNRVREIHERGTKHNVQINYVRSHLNPADLPTKGTSAEELSRNPLWLHGQPPKTSADAARLIITEHVPPQPPERVSRKRSYSRFADDELNSTPKKSKMAEPSSRRNAVPFPSPPQHLRSILQEDVAEAICKQDTYFQSLLKSKGSCVEVEVLDSEGTVGPAQPLVVSVDPPIDEDSKQSLAAPRELVRAERDLETEFQESSASRSSTPAPSSARTTATSQELTAPVEEPAIPEPIETGEGEAPGLHSSGSSVRTFDMSDVLSRFRNSEGHGCYCDEVAAKDYEARTLVTMGVARREHLYKILVIGELGKKGMMDD